MSSSSGANEAFDDLAFFYVAFTFLLVVLIPWTISVVSREWSIFRHRSKRSAFLAAPPPPESDADAFRQWYRQKNKYDYELKVEAAEKPYARFRNVSSAIFAVLWVIFIGMCIASVYLPKEGFSSFEPYAVLGVDNGASEAEIKRAYRKLSLQWHPDRHRENKEKAEEMFMLISRAYQALTDPRFSENLKTNVHTGQASVTYGLPRILTNKNWDQIILTFYLIFFILGFPLGFWYYFKYYSGAGSLSLTDATLKTLFENIDPHMSWKDAVLLFSKLPEAKDFIQRTSDKEVAVGRLFNALVEKKILEQAFAKTQEEFNGTAALMIMLAHLARIPIPECFSTDSEKLMKFVPSLCEALFFASMRRGQGDLALKAIHLSACFTQAILPDLPHPLLQLPHATPDVVRQLIEAKLKSPNEIALYCNGLPIMQGQPKPAGEVTMASFATTAAAAAAAAAAASTTSTAPAESEGAATTGPTTSETSTLVPPYSREARVAAVGQVTKLDGRPLAEFISAAEEIPIIHGSTSYTVQGVEDQIYVGDVFRISVTFNRYNPKDAVQAMLEEIKNKGAKSEPTKKKGAASASASKTVGNSKVSATASVSRLRAASPDRADDVAAGAVAADGGDAVASTGTAASKGRRKKKSREEMTPEERAADDAYFEECLAKMHEATKKVRRHTAFAEFTWDDPESIGRQAVVSPHGIQKKIERWYMLLVHRKTGAIMALHRLPQLPDGSKTVDVDVYVRPEMGTGLFQYDVIFRSDSYLGCDMNLSLEVDVKPLGSTDNAEEMMMQRMRIMKERLAKREKARRELMKKQAQGESSSAGSSKPPAVKKVVTKPGSKAKGEKSTVTRRGAGRALVEDEEEELDDELLREIAGNEDEEEEEEESKKAGIDEEAEQEDEEEDEEDDSMPHSRMTMADRLQKMLEDYSNAPGKWYYMGFSSFLEFIIHLILVIVLINVAFNYLQGTYFWPYIVKPVKAVWSIAHPAVSILSPIYSPIIAFAAAGLDRFLGRTDSMPEELRREQVRRQRMRQRPI